MVIHARPLPFVSERGPSLHVPLQQYANSRSHSLVFDISALERKESILRAELRLFTLIERDQRSYMGVSREVTIFELVDVSNDGSVDRHLKYHQLTSRYIYTVENAWETFDVTDAVKRSIQQGSRLEMFEVKIQSLYVQYLKDTMDINSDPNDIKQPVLVVFSKDDSKDHEIQVDRHEFIKQEMASIGSRGAVTPGSDDYDDDDDDDGDDDYFDVTLENKHLNNVRHKRSKNSRPPCKRRPMYVNFEELEMDEWVIAPRGYKVNICLFAV